MIVVLGCGVLGALVSGVVFYATCEPDGGYGSLFECEERALAGAFLGFMLGLPAGLVAWSRIRS